MALNPMQMSLDDVRILYSNACTYCKGPRHWKKESLNDRTDLLVFNDKWVMLPKQPIPASDQFCDIWTCDKYKSDWAEARKAKK